jgi:broad specificity phosphatase PhoE
VTLHLVRHGRPAIDRAVPAHQWPLDPSGYDHVWALRESGRLSTRAAWYCSPEPKAVQTAQLLTDAEVPIVEGLREHRRDSTDWHTDFAAVVRRAFDDPHRSAAPGWEPLAACQERVVAAVEAIRSAHPGQDLVLVGHGTAWTVLAATLTGAAPDLARWATLAMPDVLVVEDA